MVRRLGIGFACLLVAACGGGGGGGSADTACRFDSSLTSSDPNCLNAAPQAEAGLPRTVDPGDLVTLDATASNDTDGTVTTYAWTQVSGPAVTLNNASSAQASFVAPRLATLTGLIFQVRVSDNHATASTDRVTITVRAATNEPPVADAGVDQTVAGTGVVVLDGRSSADADAPLTRFLWEQVAGLPTAQLSGSDQVSATFDAPVVASPTELRFRLTVTDDLDVSNSDEVTVTVLAPTFHDIAGTITAPSGMVGDGDVNDPLAPYTMNDTLINAQPIPNPVTVGGFVNEPGTGSPGRSHGTGDVDDYFAVGLTSGTTITLIISDFTTADLDLYLVDESGITVDSSAGVGQLESIVAPAAGDYFINIKAFGGASNYNLVVGQTPLAVGGESVRLSANFVPGQAIVRMRENRDGRSLDAPDAGLAAHGFRTRAGARDRMMLIELEPGADTRIAATKVGGRGGSTPPRFRNPAAQRKWRTLMALKALANDPDIEFAEPNYLRQPFAIPNDPFYSFQWHYPLINLPAAWELETGSAGVTVAVIDTGILAGHPDFQGRIVAGFDFVSDPVNAADGNGIDADPNDPGNGGQTSIFHGTHVAGTIGAASDNNVGVAGVAWNVRLMPLRVCGTLGCSVFDQIEAMRYAAGLSNSSGTVANPPADVINLSLGGPGFSVAGQAAVDAVRAAGVIVVAAAGNEATSEPLYPASHAGVVSVSAVGPNRVRAPYSSFGTAIDVAAPGGNLGTDLNGDGYADGVLSPHANDSSGPLDYEYLFLAGTSMAAPHVAGVAALMKSANADLSPALFDLLLAQGDLTDDIGALGRDDFYGHGLIDAQKAVSAALTVAGAPPPDNPLLTASPLSLNFGSATTAIELVLGNSGSGLLQVTGVTSDQAWAQVAPLDVDGDGLGTYLVSVDRAALADGVYTAAISVTSTVNAADVPIIMTVGAAASGGNVGTLYVVLIDPVTGTTISGMQSNFAGGNYQFQLPAVPAGQYRIVAGTDTDNDGFICDDGEACGEYITRDQPIIIEVDRDLSGLDFLVNYEAPVGPLSSTNSNAAANDAGLRRPTIPFKIID